MKESTNGFPKIRIYHMTSCLSGSLKRFHHINNCHNESRTSVQALVRHDSFFLGACVALFSLVTRHMKCVYRMPIAAGYRLAQLRRVGAAYPPDSHEYPFFQSPKKNSVLVKITTFVVLDLSYFASDWSTISFKASAMVRPFRPA